MSMHGRPCFRRHEVSSPVGHDGSQTRQAPGSGVHPGAGNLAHANHLLREEGEGRSRLALEPRRPRSHLAGQGHEVGRHSDGLRPPKAGFIFVRTIFVQNGKCSPFLELTPTI